MFLMAYKLDPGHNLISRLYNSLQSINDGDTMHIKAKREGEGNFKPEMEAWEKINI